MAGFNLLIHAAPGLTVRNSRSLTPQTIKWKKPAKRLAGFLVFDIVCTKRYDALVFRKENWWRVDQRFPSKRNRGVRPKTLPLSYA
jgi:hypothetical protein